MIEYIKKHKKLFFFFILIATLVVGKVIFASTLYELYTPGGTSYRSEISSSLNLRGQTFLSTSTAHTICSVIMKGGRDGTGGNAYMNIYGVSGGLPSGFALGTSNVFDYSGLSDYPTENEMEFIFDPCITISTNTEYAWAVYRTSGTLWVSGLDPGDYTDGDFVYSNDTGATWGSAAPGDLWFEIYGDPAEEPAPAPSSVNNTYILAAVGLIGVCVFLFDTTRRHFIMKKDT